LSEKRVLSASSSGIREFDVVAKKGSTDSEPKSPALRLAEELQRRPFTAAAIVGGAAAATAGAFLGARALARRNGGGEGKPVNAVLQSAITACEAAHACREQDKKGGK
jgi:hypothetical protein